MFDRIASRCLGAAGEDDFPREVTTGYAVYTTARHFGRLAKRVLRGVA